MEGDGPERAKGVPLATVVGALKVPPQPAIVVVGEE